MDANPRLDLGAYHLGGSLELGIEQGLQIRKNIGQTTGLCEKLPVPHLHFGGHVVGNECA